MVASGTPGETGIVPTGCLKKKFAMAAGVGPSAKESDRDTFLIPLAILDR